MPTYEELVEHALNKIIKCEGGALVEVTVSGVKTVNIVTPIPEEHWCKACKERRRFQINALTRLIKLQRRKK